MNRGADALIQTMVDAGIDTCFTNPGTSEMHFVAALDRVPGMRAVLGLCGPLLKSRVNFFFFG